MIKGNKKVKNARKVDEFGEPILNLKEWKEANPGKVYFDSKLEQYFYASLKEAGISFSSKPEKLILVPKMTALDWEHTPENLKILRDMQKGVTNKTEKAANTRWFNKNYNKSLTEVSVPAWTWSPDFLLPDHNMYVDTKGNKKDAHWRNKLKTARRLLEEKGMHVIQLQTKKEINEFIKSL